MKRSAIIFAGIAIGVLSLCIAPGPATAEDSLHAKSVTDTITELERSWIAAIVARDIGTLDRLLADEFNGTNPDGYTFNKDMAITGVYVGSMDIDEISINVYGNTAVAFTTQREKSKSGSDDFSDSYVYTDVWRRRMGIGKLSHPMVLDLMIRIRH